MITLAGGTGLVGKTLTQALVRDGEQVRVLTREPNAAAAAFGDVKLKIVGVDFDDDVGPTPPAFGRDGSSDVLFINAEPGALVCGRIRELIRTWPNLTETTVSGTHFIQEDSHDEIGAAVAEFVRTNSAT